MALSFGQEFFSIDISDGALRLIQLNKKGKKNIITSYNELALPAGVITNGEITDEKKLIELIKKLTKTARRLNGRKVISVLPETKTFIKVIEIKTPEDKNSYQQLVNDEIVNHIPMALEEIYLDWQIIEKKPDTTKILIGAAAKNIVESYFLALEKSGLSPYILEIESAAIIRSLIDKNDIKPRIIIDFGAARSSLIIYDHGTVQFTVSLPISGNNITETIEKTLKLDHNKAEEAKIVCGLDPQRCEGALLKILLKPIDDISKHIKKSLIFYKSNFSEASEIAEIILCGGGSNFIGIDKVIAQKLNLPVAIGNPMIKIKNDKKGSIPKERILSYTTAIGLALRSFDKKTLYD
ncbi:MAG: type IV pilus assembly protein PilM [Candidatus Buchananbacteria bacterium]|nr:type IV pilus assembly protein PilM [Candidatus Buchananbacteria bacterium]